MCWCFKVLVSHGIAAVQKHAISMTQGPKPPLETAEQRRCRVCIGCNNAHVSHVNMVRDCLWRLWGHWTVALQHCDRPCHCVHAPASRASCEHARNQIAKWCFLLLWFGILEPSWNHAEESPDRNPGMKRSLKSPAGTMSWVAPSVSRFVSSRIDTSCTSFLSCSSTYQLSQWYFHSVKMCQMCQMCPWLELKDRSGNTQLLAFVASKSCWCGHFRKMCWCFKVLVSHGIAAVQKHAISMTQGPKPPLETAEQRRCRVCIGCNNAHVSHVNMVRDCLWRLWGHWTVALQHCDRPCIIDDTERLHSCKSIQHYKNLRLWVSALAGSQ